MRRIKRNHGHFRIPKNTFTQKWMFLFAEIDCTNDYQDSLERRLMCRGLNIRPGGVRPNLKDYVRIVDNSLVSIQRVLVIGFDHILEKSRETSQS